MAVPVSAEPVVAEKITIGLYGLEGKNWDAALTEVSNIKRIYEKFKAAAEVRGKPAPQIVLSVYLIPDWNTGSSFDGNYDTQRMKFLASFRRVLIEQGLSEIVTLEDFYAETTPIEKAYLVNLTARGSNADMVKMHALIKPENQAVKHLQMDSNTQILSYQSLYDVTFGSPHPALTAGVMLNVCCYASDYVAGMNKIVYTTPESVFVGQLIEMHSTYCSAHAQDMGREKTEANSIYSKDFAAALEKAGLAIEVRKKGHPVYPVVGMSRPEFSITPTMVTAQHQSWRKKSILDALGPTDPLVLLSKIGETVFVKCGDAICDFDGFMTLLSKHIDSLSLHSPEEDGTHKELLRISNEKAERHLMRAYFIALAERLKNSQYLTPKECKAIMEAAVTKIPDTPFGNELTQSLFGCTVAQLHTKPFEIMNWSLMKQCASNPITMAYIRKIESATIPKEFGSDLVMIEAIDTRAGRLFSEKEAQGIGKPLTSIIQEAASAIIKEHKVEQSLEQYRDSSETCRASLS